MIRLLFFVLVGQLNQINLFISYVSAFDNFSTVISVKYLLLFMFSMGLLSIVQVYFKHLEGLDYVDDMSF